MRRTDMWEERIKRDIMDYLNECSDEDLFGQTAGDMCNLYYNLFNSKFKDKGFPPMNFSDYSWYDEEFVIIFCSLNLLWSNTKELFKWVGVDFWATTYREVEDWREWIATYLARILYEAYKLKKAVEMPEWDFIFLKS
jgi:hypothetical protein